MSYIASQSCLLADAERGKMFGVLVVEANGTSGNRTKKGSLGYLAAYSGLLAGRNDWPFFVPPVFDAQQPDGHFKIVERQISAINEEVRNLESEYSEYSEHSEKVSQKLAALKQQRKQFSEELQLWLFSQYRMLNARGEVKDLVEIWRDYHSSPKIQQRFPLPPGGSGDCCAPKLLQYAYRHHLHPVAMAEFWYGSSPRGEIRHHGQFYPACRGKCLPILTFMLQGLDAEAESPNHLYPIQGAMLRPTMVYADEAIFVIDKPSGLLSVPGRIDAPSVQSYLSEDDGKVFMPHRLDMDTSGLMVVARTETAYKQLQQQFYARTVYKRYEALLNGMLEPGTKGSISLPLRPDPLDRPRQVVDWLHGKAALTDYEVLELNDQPSYSSSPVTLVSLVPHTGRTHQLRVHCAHPEGLGMPIVGDALYGRKANRLCLHAAELSFDHPVTGERLHFYRPTDFV